MFLRSLEFVLKESGIFFFVGLGEIEIYCFDMNIKLSFIVVLFLEVSIYFLFLIVGCCLLSRFIELN